MLWFIVVVLFLGVVFGLIARAVVPGPDPMSFLGTAVLGIVGSFVGGFLGYLVAGADRVDGPIQMSGIIGSIIGSILTLLAYRMITDRNGRTALR